MKASKLAKRYRITHGKKFRLKDCDPSDKDGFSSVKDWSDLLQKASHDLQKMQDKLYARNQWSLLIIIQAMDAAGKDGTIKHVMSGINPQGCEVHSFKSPSTEELDHDFLWRSTCRLPRRGKIGLFNRSYYEEVLIARVHPELLEKQKLPEECLGDNIWKDRFEDINAFERHMVRNGTRILKFFLNISPGEQKKRFIARLEDPRKHWKFSASDVQERKFWPQYMHAYEDMIRNTSTSHAPWYVVPANNKSYAHIVVGAVILDALEKLNLSYPKVSKAQMQSLQAARKSLE
ncbi:MAG: polyphosphate kinase 2 family protein [Puniceicoccales bacterium]|jgi:PPK2 family polyphosphate:nucleotide phosphotransferase|nr:polyphosphate kinase 2 family protein [Puniceicoccales bacterium]